MIDGLTRLDDTPIHKALREALANCVSNADFYGERGLVIRNNMDEIILENPGTFRIEMREALSGGVSSPRNPVILKMFNLLNIGERTGSGIPLIVESWKGEGFNEPEYTEQIEINRSFLSLSFKCSSDKKQAINASDKKQMVNAANAKPKAKKSEDSKRIILDYLSLRPSAISKEVAGHLGVSPDRARVYLQGFVSSGIAIAEGENRNRTYRLKPKV
jgi:predicted HTH transcriptional regulator